VGGKLTYLFYKLQNCSPLLSIGQNFQKTMCFSKLKATSSYQVLLNVCPSKKWSVTI